MTNERGPTGELPNELESISARCDTLVGGIIARTRHSLDQGASPDYPSDALVPVLTYAMDQLPYTDDGFRAADDLFGILRRLPGLSDSMMGCGSYAAVAAGSFAAAKAMYARLAKERDENRAAYCAQVREGLDAGDIDVYLRSDFLDGVVDEAICRGVPPEQFIQYYAENTGAWCIRSMQYYASMARTNPEQGIYRELCDRTARELLEPKRFPERVIIAAAPLAFASLTDWLDRERLAAQFMHAADQVPASGKIFDQIVKMGRAILDDETLGASHVGTAISNYVNRYAANLVQRGSISKDEVFYRGLPWQIGARRHIGVPAGDTIGFIKDTMKNMRVMRRTDEGDKVLGASEGTARLVAASRERLLAGLARTYVHAGDFENAAAVLDAVDDKNHDILLQECLDVVPDMAQLKHFEPGKSTRPRGPEATLRYRLAVGRFSASFIEPYDVAARIVGIEKGAPNTNVSSQLVIDTFRALNEQSRDTARWFLGNYLSARRGQHAAYESFADISNLAVAAGDQAEARRAYSEITGGPTASDYLLHLVDLARALKSAA